MKLHYLNDKIKVLMNWNACVGCRSKTAQPRPPSFYSGLCKFSLNRLTRHPIAISCLHRTPWLFRMLEALGFQDLYMIAGWNLQHLFKWFLTSPTVIDGVWVLPPVGGSVKFWETVWLCQADRLQEVGLLGDNEQLTVFKLVPDLEAPLISRPGKHQLLGRDNVVPATSRQHTTWDKEEYRNKKGSNGVLPDLISSLLKFSLLLGLGFPKVVKATPCLCFVLDWFGTWRNASSLEACWLFWRSEADYHGSCFLFRAIYSPKLKGGASQRPNAWER